MTTLQRVKTLLGITDTFHDEILDEYIEETQAFLIDAGVSEEKITPGIIARGVSDLWNFGAGDGSLSPYFMQRAAQLALK